MTLRAALVIVLRFYALTFALETLGLMPGLATVFKSDFTTFEWILVLEIAAFFIVAIFIWTLAGRLATALTRGLDGNLIFQINFEEACALAFVVFGIYFALKGIAPLLMALFQLLQWDGPHAVNDQFQVRLVQDAQRWGIEFAAGMASVAGARKWARLIALRISASN